jgi:hypothetical protein
VARCSAPRGQRRSTEAPTVSINLPGNAVPLNLALPVAGQVDLREASTWFAIERRGAR